MNEICSLYRDAQEQSREGAHVIFTDEMTGVQALEHKYEDFMEAVKALVGTDPEAPWTFVCDGLNTHKSEALVRFVAETCVPSTTLLNYR